MTLNELSSFITTKLQDTDAASVTACKSFINRRYQMIWDSSLWTETLGVSEKAVAAAEETSTIDVAPSVTFFHSASVPATGIDFPVAVRFTVTGQTSGLDISGNDWVSFFQLDPNAWTSLAGRNTTPKGFINLPKNGAGSPRVKLVPVPDVAGTLFVLGKLRWVTLGDTDSPCLRGVDNALLAFAEGDMLERARQYGKAQSKFAEAAAHIAVMRDIEKGQQQSISSITPMEEGYHSVVYPQ